ncbi:MAG: hypothetical protein JNJ73_21725 [Hyphomonadaceae bacterium]|nr:hypothetical protein [Hyphomonadaceae bacterium]
MADYLTVIHEVKDFGAWKPVYDADAPNRAAAGLTDLMVVRHADNPNRVALLFGVSDRAKAKAMAESPQLREAMERAGVIGAPTVRLRHGDFTRKDSGTYLTINCSVEGIDKFRNGYAMDASDRRNATLEDLGLLQNVDDPNDVLLIWSVGNAERVKAFMSSPALAEHQKTHAGVTAIANASFWTR